MSFQNQHFLLIGFIGVYMLPDSDALQFVTAGRYTHIYYVAFEVSE